MASEWMLIGVLLAVLGFWTVGAYNRLMSLRLAIALAWAKVQEALGLRDAAVQPLVQALHEPLAAEHGALMRWAEDHAAAQAAAAEVSAQPLAQQPVAAWVKAESALGASTSRVMALIEQHTELQQQEQVRQLCKAWQEGQARLPFVRQQCNEAVQNYNKALLQAPTSWLVPLFRLRPAHSL